MSSYENLFRLDMTYRDDTPRIRAREGVELYYEIRGEGNVITPLNNFAITPPIWRVFTEELARHYRILTYDLCNHGQSTRVEEEPTWEEHAADLIALLDALEIESTYLIGSSTSTVFARDIALNHPDRVKGMVLAGPVFGPRGMRRQRQLQRNWLRTLESHGLAGMYEHFYPELFSSEMNEALGTPGYLGFREAFMAMATPEDLASGLRQSMRDNHSPDLPPRISTPTLVIVGDDDMLLSPSGAKELSEQFPNGCYEVMPKAGHQPYIDDAEGFQAIILKFIRDVETHA
ncbi:alpha/beta fold hydrolase [Actinomadura mexicana]|uniref:Pimeloyl-ACP methyl ester carboxylesterase n=1 Tax=Actinomadura mexicana TaxID=134959 RepID=A0A238XMZ6_9ACTN|nr:alpha/beta fold hydrolase [Actinomadura mexicana]SNR59349.1 Pimeloyl-ACP methyl ester carboxylesterase [Actinomadura mexicana]